MKKEHLLKIQHTGIMLVRKNLTVHFVNQRMLDLWFVLSPPPMALGHFFSSLGPIRCLESAVKNTFNRQYGGVCVNHFNGKSIQTKFHFSYGFAGGIVILESIDISRAESHKRNSALLTAFCKATYKSVTTHSIPLYPTSSSNHFPFHSYTHHEKAEVACFTRLEPFCCHKFELRDDDCKFACIICDNSEGKRSLGFQISSFSKPDSEKTRLIVPCVSALSTERLLKHSQELWASQLIGFFVNSYDIIYGLSGPAVSAGFSEGESISILFCRHGPVTTRLLQRFGNGRMLVQHAYDSNVFQLCFAKTATSWLVVLNQQPSTDILALHPAFNIRPFSHRLKQSITNRIITMVHELKAAPIIDGDSEIHQIVDQNHQRLLSVLEDLLKWDLRRYRKFSDLSWNDTLNYCLKAVEKEYDVVLQFESQNIPATGVPLWVSQGLYDILTCIIVHIDSNPTIEMLRQSRVRNDVLAHAVVFKISAESEFSNTFDFLSTFSKAVESLGLFLFSQHNSAFELEQIAPGITLLSLFVFVD